MKNNFDDNYKNLKIFDNIKQQDIPKVIKCLNATQKKIQRDTSVFKTGEKIDNIFILLSGNMYAYTINSTGERNILFELKKGDILCGTSIFSDENSAPYEITSISESCVLCIDPKNLLANDFCSCNFKNIVLNNLIHIISNENKFLREKIDITNIKSLREKIFKYIYFQSLQNNSKKFTIPFVNRLDFADYLGVNVSALSRELSRMKNDEIIDFYKNSFEIK